MGRTYDIIDADFALLAPQQIDRSDGWRIAEERGWSLYRRLLNGPRPGLAPYVMVTGPNDGAAAGGRSYYLSSKQVTVLVAARGL